jgi:hypothetical protein
MTPDELIAKYQNKPPHPNLPRGLDKIDWSSLHDAYGSAECFPVFLNASLHENKEDSKLAFHELWGTIWHQGTIYQVTAYAVPFIAEILQSSYVVNKESYAMLLTDCLTGSPSFGSWLSKEEELRWRKIYDSQGRDFDKTLEECNRTAIEVKEVGRQCVQLLYPYLKEFENDHWVRGRIARALSVYPEFADQSISLLKQALENEDDEEARDDFIDAIDRLEKNKS